MNSLAIRFLATLFPAPLPVDAVVQLDQHVVGAPMWVDVANDALYLSSRLPGFPSDTWNSPQLGNQRGASPRGDCTECESTESESNCAIPVDTVNGGCNSTPPVFSSLECGAAFCGTTATNGIVRDTDWWAFELDQRSIVRVAVTADFLPQLGIGDMGAGCPISSLATGVFGEICTPTHVAAMLSPGSYIVFVAPQFIAAETCGARYAGAIECIPCPCAGDFNSDGEVSLSDLALILSCFGISPSNPCMDVDLDGAIGLQDLASFLPEFGKICP